MNITGSKWQAQESIWIKLRVNHNSSDGYRSSRWRRNCHHKITTWQINESISSKEMHDNKNVKKTQLAYNMKIEGGFLPMLAGLIPFITGTDLPALGVGALSRLASKCI